MGRLPLRRSALLFRGGGVTVALVAIWFWPLGAPHVTPSFDCARAALPTERAICADPALSKIDADLAVLYQENIQTAAGFNDLADVEKLKSDERDFLQTRNRCGTAKWCIERVYAKRDLQLEELGGAPEQAASLRGDSRHPVDYLGGRILRLLRYAL